MEANPEQFDELKADFRMGKFGKEVEAELVEILQKSSQNWPLILSPARGEMEKLFIFFPPNTRGDMGGSVGVGYQW